MTWGMLGTIVLTLLKILGILLLIALVFILLVLLVPVRYQISAVFDEKYQVQGKLHWLCYMVCLPFQSQDGQVEWKLRILGIPVRGSTSGNAGRRKRKHRRKRKSAPSRDATIRQKKMVQPRDTADQQKKTVQPRDTADRQEKTVQSRDMADRQEKTVQKSGDSAETGYKQSEDAQNKREHKPSSIFQRIGKRIRELYQRFRSQIRGIRRKIHSFRDLLDLLQEEYTRRFICIARDNMLHLWKQLRPRKIRGTLRFGTGDPCSTGQILGIIAMFYGWIGTGVRITPDFEESCFEGRLEIKGRIAIISIVIFVIRLATNQDLDRLQREWGQWKEDF